VTKGKRPEDEDTVTQPAPEKQDDEITVTETSPDGAVEETITRPPPGDVVEVEQTLSDESSFFDPGPDRFKLGKIIGEGGMATVCEARDGRLSRVVAVKRMRPELTSDNDLRLRFMREARIMAELAHPGTVAVYDAGTHGNGELFYAMERVHGQTLGELMKARGRAEIRDRHAILGLVGIFERVCETMAYAHAKGIIHRDLKPANIMVDRFGAVFVMDWGIAKRVVTQEEQPVDDSRTRVGEVIGTPGYMSPEQAQGLEDAADFQTDVFALGVILYGILTGERAFEGRSQKDLLKEILYHEPAPPQSRNPTVGRELSAVCMKALAKDPRRRYPSAKELADDIRRLREFLPVSAIEPRLIDHLSNWVLRNKIFAAVLGTLMIVGIAAGAALGTQAYLSNQLLSRGFDLVEASRQQVATLSASIDGLRGRLDGSLGDAGARRRLETELQERRAQLRFSQLQLRSRLAAVIGFTARSPDPRALRLFREQTLQVVEYLLDDGDYLMAKTFAASTLEQAERTELLAFSPDEIARLREALADAESGLGRLRATEP
jgi:serine/threonine protein kinase